MAHEPRGRISDLYHQALERPPEDREAFLDQACGGDDTLREEVESLLGYAAVSAAFLEQPAAALGHAETPPRTPAEPLPVDRRVGPYAIVAPLGAGGMGEVYRARDTKLGREVALKILPPHLVADPERRARFAREARVLATLNHPNIGAIYGLEEADGLTALVLELVQGQTLADRLERGPLRIPQALAVGRQIADALDAAHETGIVHRDLKPANIVLQGAPGSDTVVAKVLDFGLAKLQADGQPASADDPMNSPTLTVRGTQVGVILGTPAYMSPEQARGLAVNKRTDIWAFGCVLFEMLTGRPAFQGATTTDTLVRVLDHEPDWTALPEQTPPALRSVLRRCLRKDPQRRLRDVADAGMALEDEDFSGSPAGGAMPPRRLHSPRFWIGTTLLCASIAALLTAQALWRSPSVRPVVRALLPPPEDLRPLSVGFYAGPAVLSSDGRRVAFAASGPDGTSRLYVHSLASLVTQALPGTEGASYPFWNPDGDQLGFFADRNLKRITIGSGNVTTLAAASYGVGGSWNRDDIIVFAPSPGSALQRVPAAGGAPRPVTTLNADRGETAHRWPAFLPDGNRFLFAAGQHGQAGPWTIRVGSLDSQRVEDVIEAHSNAVYANGFLLFVRNGRLLAQPVHQRSLRASGEPAVLAEGVLHDVVLGRGVFSASQTGLLVYQTGSAAAASRLVWLDRQGQEVGVLDETCFCIWPHLSPDGERTAVVVTDATTGNTDIRIYEHADNRRLQLTFEPTLQGHPVWTPEGSRVIFTSTRAGVRDIHWKSSDSSGTQEPLLESDREKLVQSASAEGVIFVQDGNLWLMPWTGSRTPRALTSSEHLEQFGQVSPNGRWLLYQSNERGTTNLYVTSFPALSGRWLVAENRLLPKWSANGREIYFLTQDHSTLFAAAVNGDGDAFRISNVQRLFSVPLVTGRGYPYDVSSDGQRFVAVTSAGTTTPLTLVMDWPSEVGR